MIPILEVHSISRVDAKTVANTLIFTTESCKKFHPIGAIVVATSQSGLTTGCFANIGSNASNYNNMGSSLHPETLDRQEANIGGGMPVLASGTDVYLRIATAANATTQEVYAAVIGYYEPSC